MENSFSMDNYPKKPFDITKATSAEATFTNATSARSRTSFGSFNPTLFAFNGFKPNTLSNISTEPGTFVFRGHPSKTRDDSSTNATSVKNKFAEVDSKPKSSNVSIQKAWRVTCRRDPGLIYFERPDGNGWMRLVRGHCKAVVARNRNTSVPIFEPKSSTGVFRQSTRFSAETPGTSGSRDSGLNQKSIPTWKPTAYKPIFTSSPSVNKSNEINCPPTKAPPSFASLIESFTEKFNSASLLNETVPEKAPESTLAVNQFVENVCSSAETLTTCSSDIESSIQDPGPGSALKEIPSEQTSRTIDSASGDVLGMLIVINRRLDAMNAKLNSLPGLQNRLDESIAKINALNEQNKIIVAELASLRIAQESNQAEVRRVSSPVLNSNIIVSGAPCKSSTDTSEVLRQVAAALGAPLELDDIISSRYLITPSAAWTNKPIPILAKLRSPSVCAKLLAAKKSKGRLLSSEVWTSPSWAFPVPKAYFIHVNELLPSDTHKLFNAVKIEAKQCGIKYIWHRGGRIFARKSDNTRVIRVHSVDDIQILNMNH